MAPKDVGMTAPSRRQIIQAFAAAGTVGVMVSPSAQAAAIGKVAPPHSAAPSIDWIGKMKIGLQEQPLEPDQLGALASFEPDVLPLLKGVTVRVQVLAPGAAREPHWHAGKIELNYVLEGQGEIGIQEPSGRLLRIPVKPGSATMIPYGMLHYILNTGETTMRLLICFNDVFGRSFSLSSSLRAFSKERTATSLRVETKDLPAWPPGEAALYTRPQSLAPVEQTEELLFLGQPVNVNIETLKAIESFGGRSRTIDKGMFPGLDGLSLKRLELDAGATRTIHWHPQGDELTYVAKGEVEFGLMAPGNSAKTDVLIAKAGDAVNVPEGWLHYIANVGEVLAELYELWNVAEVQEVQFANAFSSLPIELSAASGGGISDEPFFASLLGKTSSGVSK